MKVYIVTEGCYSAYHIEALFLEREQAVKYIEMNLDEYTDYSIEEYEANEKAPRSDNHIYSVSLINRHWACEELNTFSHYDPQLIENPYHPEIGDEFIMTMFAKDEEHALKIAQDAKAKMKAERIGL